MIPELRDILFLDIETVACTGNYHLLDERIRIQWERKASWIKRDEGVSDEQLFIKKQPSMQSLEKWFA